MVPHENLASLFSPETIAVIGASPQPGSVGHTVLVNLLDGGFFGSIYPVCEQASSILGIPAVGKVADLPDGIDLALICLPQDRILQTLEELVAKTLRAAVIFGPGYRDIPGLEEAVGKLVRHHRIALLGPRSVGLIHARSRLTATSAPGPLPRGAVGFMSQSRGLFAATSDWARGKKIGFSSFVSLGERATLSESDFLSWMANDPETKVIMGYLEDIESGSRFMRNAHMATREKPVIFLRGGRTREGKRAAAAHSGNVAGAHNAYEAAFRQTGIIQVDQLEELFHLSQAFATQPLPNGPGVGIVANGGGPATVAIDACENTGLVLARFGHATLEALRSQGVAAPSLYNPLCLDSFIPAQDFVRAAQLAYADPAVNSLLLILTPGLPSFTDQAADSLAETFKESEKPVTACFMGGNSVQPGREALTAAGIPTYHFPEEAVRSLAAMHRFALWKSRPLPVEISYRHDLSRAGDILDKARADGLTRLDGLAAQGLLKAFEMPILETHLARTSAEAVQAARQVGFPVRLSLSTDKSVDRTGVMRNLDSVEEVREAFMELTNRAISLSPSSRIDGCLVQPMPPRHARAVSVTMSRDRVFGPLITLGLIGPGGHVETRYSSRIAPLCLDDVHDMVREVVAASRRSGDEGLPHAALTPLEDILLILSQLSTEMPEVSQAVCEPIFLSDEATLVGKASFFLSQDGEPDPDPAD